MGRHGLFVDGNDNDNNWKSLFDINQSGALRFVMIASNNISTVDSWSVFWRLTLDNVVLIDHSLLAPPLDKQGQCLVGSIFLELDANSPGGACFAYVPFAQNAKLEVRTENHLEADIVAAWRYHLTG